MFDSMVGRRRPVLESPFSCKLVRMLMISCGKSVGLLRFNDARIFFFCRTARLFQSKPRPGLLALCCLPRVLADAGWRHGHVTAERCAQRSKRSLSASLCSTLQHSTALLVMRLSLKGCSASCSCGPSGLKLQVRSRFTVRAQSFF